MTIIACANNIMVADSRRYSGGVTFKLPPGANKISRSPCGSLVGMAGLGSHTFVGHKWVVEGMDFSKLPKLPEVDDDQKNERLVWLWLRPDGRLFRGDHNFDYHELAQPESIGVQDACWIWQGAVLACHDPVKAIRITLENCQYVGGEPQIEYLSMPEPGSIIEVDGEALRLGRIVPVSRRA